MSAREWQVSEKAPKGDYLVVTASDEPDKVGTVTVMPSSPIGTFRVQYNPDVLHNPGLMRGARSGFETNDEARAVAEQWADAIESGGWAALDALLDEPKASSGPSREALIASIIEQANALRAVSDKALPDEASAAVAELDRYLAEVDDELSSHLAYLEETGAL